MKTILSALTKEELKNTDGGYYYNPLLPGSGSCIPTFPLPGLGG